MGSTVGQVPPLGSLIAGSKYLDTCLIDFCTTRHFVLHKEHWLYLGIHEYQASTSRKVWVLSFQ